VRVMGLRVLMLAAYLMIWQTKKSCSFDHISGLLEALKGPPGCQAREIAPSDLSKMGHDEDMIMGEGIWLAGWSLY